MSPFYEISSRFFKFSLVYPPGSETLDGEQESERLPVSEIEKYLGLEVDEENMETLIEVLPESLRCIIGDILLPEDGGLAISEAIVEGICIGISDGSLVKDFRNT